MSEIFKGDNEIPAGQNQLCESVNLPAMLLAHAHFHDVATSFLHEDANVSAMLIAVSSMYSVADSLSRLLNLGYS